MDAEVKQRNRRRKRAQRMQAQRESQVKDGDSAEEDETPVREKPPRPPNRRKKSKEPLVEEDIVDGFAILGFKTYDDLQTVLSLASKENIRRLVEVERPKLESRTHITHHISAHPPHSLTLTQDPATSDDSGRASERLTGSSVAPRDADSSRDRLSDASSRCSSGKGYICDSEGDDDKGSDTSSVIFASAPASRKHEFPGALPPSLPSNGARNSPVPAPTPQDLPAPLPAPAQLPPPPPAPIIAPKPPPEDPPEKRQPSVADTMTVVAANPPPPKSVPPSMPAMASVPVPVPVSKPADSQHARTESPAVATSAPSYHPAYQPLYTPYASQTVVPTPAATVTAPSQKEVVAHRPSSSPRGHSPTRERDSYSSNVSSLSRSSVTPVSHPGPTTTASSSLKSWGGPPRPTPPLQSFPAPMFTTPLPPPVSVSNSGPPPPTNPNPFSAESLFQTNQADMLRRELDNRFLASQDRSLNVAPPPYLRTEMHQHQHHHTHVHQHTTSLMPQPPSSALFPSPLFKDIPKLGGLESPFYRQNLGMPNYPGYSPGLLHPGLTGPTPFVPPNHLPAFQPKPAIPDPNKPKTVKSGKWNAMHVRVAWEIYHHQQKGDKGASTKTDLLRPPSHLFSPSVHATRPHELPFPASLSSHRPPPTFDQPHPGSLFSSPASHIGSTMSPFTRYGSGYSANSSPFSVSPYPPSRDLPLTQMHDPWRGLPRTVPTFPPSVSSLPPTLPGLQPPAPWTIKPDPIIEQREREEREREQRERERLRREREERERREREEKQRRLEQQQQQERERERREKERREMERREMEQRERERERLLHQQRLAESAKMAPVLRDRSPMRNGTMDSSEIRVKEEPRTKEDESVLLARTDPRYHPYLRHPSLPPQMIDRSRVMPGVLPHHYPPPPPSTHWPPHSDFYRYEPLRYNSLVVDAMRAEEERVKLFGGYPPHPSQLRPKDPGLMHLRPPHKMCATPPTDIHKKEEPR